LVVTHDEHREALGAYVLDALEPWENRRVEEHLMSCADCQREFTELSAVPVLLAQLPTAAVLDRYADDDLADIVPLPSPAPSPAPAPGAEPAVKPASKPPVKPVSQPADKPAARPVAEPRRPAAGPAEPADLGKARERRRRFPVRRPLTIGIAASVLVGGLTAGAVAVALTGSGKPHTGPTATASASVTTRQLTGANLTNATSGRATLSAVGPNTEIYVSLSGLTPGKQYQWSVVDAAGARQSLGTFAVPHDELSGLTNTQALTALKLGDIASVVIQDAAGAVVLTLTP
jgi:anti-sigma factor RsiW